MDTKARGLQSSASEYLAETANYYRLLARLYYRELDSAFIEDLAEGLNVIGLDDTSDELERAFALGNNKMARYIERRNPDTLTETRCDYARTFLGAGANSDNPVSPFESVYTSEERLLMQGARDEVYRLFRSEGLALEDEFNMPEDHISFEFQYLARLADRACGASEEGSSSQEDQARYVDFFRAHVLNWVPQFCDDVMQLARTSFYRGLAQCTKAWVLMEADLWGVEPAGIDSAPNAEEVQRHAA